MRRLPKEASSLNDMDSDDEFLAEQTEGDILQVEADITDAPEEIEVTPKVSLFFRYHYN